MSNEITFTEEKKAPAKNGMIMLFSLIMGLILAVVIMIVGIYWTA